MRTCSPCSREWWQTVRRSYFVLIATQSREWWWRRWLARTSTVPPLGRLIGFSVRHRTWDIADNRRSVLVVGETNKRTENESASVIDLSSNPNIRRVHLIKRDNSMQRIKGDVLITEVFRKDCPSATPMHDAAHAERIRVEFRHNLSRNCPPPRLYSVARPRELRMQEFSE